MKAIFRILGTAAAVAATGAAIVIMDKLLNEKAAPIIESIEFPEEAEKDDAEAAKTAEAYAEGETKAEAEAAAPAEETAPAEEPAASESEAAPAEAAEPVTLPDLSKERPVCDPEAPNPNPVEAGPAVAPKDESGKFDPTKIADVSDFGDWEEQGGFWMWRTFSGLWEFQERAPMSWYTHPAFQRSAGADLSRSAKLLSLNGWQKAPKPYREATNKREVSFPDLQYCRTFQRGIQREKT